jgi:hypothetical protein
MFSVFRTIGRLTAIILSILFRLFYFFSANRRRRRLWFLSVRCSIVTGRSLFLRVLADVHVGRVSVKKYIFRGSFAAAATSVPSGPCSPS